MSALTDCCQALRDYTNRSDITDQVASVWILAAETHFNANLRVREMIKRVDLTYGADSLQLPTDYLMWNTLRYKPDAASAIPNVRRGRTLEYVGMDAFWERESDTYTSKKPSFTLDGFEAFVHGATANVSEFVLSYFGKVTPLSGNNEIWPSYKHLYIYGAMAESATYLEDDERIPQWKAERDSLVTQSNEVMRSGQYGSAPLQPRFRSFG